MTHTLDVICVGSANYDTIASVARVPADDERITTNAFVTAGGGPAATAAVALARLGARVGICGVIGNDPAGEHVRESLERENVDTTWLRTDPGAQTGQAVVLAAEETGSRSIITTIVQGTTPEEIPLGLSTWLHADQTGFGSAHHAVLHDSGTTKLSVDAGNPIRQLNLRGVDLYVPTLSALLARYAGADRETAFARAREEGAHDVVATAGAEGTYVLMPAGVERIGTFDIELESTIGAGDVFHGALLAGLVREESLPEAILAANATAALACRGLDGRSAIPTLAELREFLHHNEPRG